MEQGIVIEVQTAEKVSNNSLLSGSSLNFELDASRHESILQKGFLGG